VFVVDKLIFIQVVPSDFYFLWQIEVQIVNFRKFNVSNKMEVLVSFRDEKELKSWYELRQKYSEVKFFFYQNLTPNISLYIPQLRPQSLKRHKFNKEAVYFYHDSDIIFQKLPDFEGLITGNICWQSNCSHYLDYAYLNTKEIEGNIQNHEGINKMAEIGGITLEDIQSYTGKTGGAQTILRNLDGEFWEDVENQSIKIREAFTHINSGNTNSSSINTKYFPSEDMGFQSWCADMWALNFSQWKRRIVTNVSDELEFSWATDDIDNYYRKNIFHNAGALKESDIFYKADYMHKSPIGDKFLRYNLEKASSKYVEAIWEV